MSVSTQSYEYIIHLVQKASGIEIGKDKEYLIEARLAPILLEFGFKNIDELVGHLAVQSTSPLMKRLTDALTTNESLFFRDARPFQFLQNSFIPKLLSQPNLMRRLRVWSAACSTGQEPYSLSIMLQQLEPKMAGWSTEILATDLCTPVLERAKRGLYSAFEVQRGLDPLLLQTYFEQVPEGWQVKASVKSQVTFQEINLLEANNALGQFDIVLCRNVLIYFGSEIKQLVLSNIAAKMKSHSILFLGGSESLLGLETPFEKIEEDGVSYYKLKKSNV